MFGLSWGVIRLISYGLLAASLLGGMAYVKHEWDAGQKARAQIVELHHQQRVQTAAQVQVVAQAATAETAAQSTLQAQARVIVRRIPVYVSRSPSPVVGCVTWGMLRLHDAAALGLDPSDLPASPGVDAACSAVAPAALADTIARNYAAARANAEQLNALEADIRAQAAVAANASPPAPVDAPLAVDVPY